MSKISNKIRDKKKAKKVLLKIEKKKAKARAKAEKADACKKSKKSAISSEICKSGSIPITAIFVNFIFIYFREPQLKLQLLLRIS